MQIRIIQTEIEEAIRAHINQQVSVREGMRIDISLSATRGPEGFIATIDIVPEDAERAPVAEAEVQTPAPAPAPASPPAPRVTRTPRATPTPAPQPDPAPAPDAAPAAAQTGTEAPSEEDLAPAGTVPPATPAPAAAEPATERRSLFAGVTTPKNS